MKKAKRLSLLIAAGVLIMGGYLVNTLKEEKVAKAESEAYKTLSFPDDNKDNNQVSSYFKEWDAIIGEDTYHITNANNNKWNKWSYIKFGNKTDSSTGSIITPVFNESISSVTLTINDITLKYVTSITISTADSVTASKWKWSEPINFPVTKNTSSIDLPVPVKNKSYKIEFNCLAGSANGIITLGKVEFFKEDDIDLTNYENITNLIGNIGKVEYSDLCKKKITKAREAYDNASEEIKELVNNASENNLATLTAAETEFTRLAAIANEKTTNVSNLISSLSSNVEESTLSKNYTAIINAKNAFNALTHDEKALVSEEQITKLDTLINALSNYNLSMDLVKTGALDSDATLLDSANIKTGSSNNRAYYAIIKGNTITSKSIITYVNGLEINYSLALGKYGQYNADKDLLSIGAYVNDTLVSNEVTITLENTADDVYFNGSFKLKDNINSFNIVIKSSSTSGGNQFVKINDASYSYVALDTAEKFIEDWAALRNKGGNDGICYYLSNEHRAEIEAMIERYNKFIGEDKDLIANTEDGGTTIAKTIEYVKTMLNQLDNKDNIDNTTSAILVTKNNSDDKTLMITLLVTLMVITISGYYSIEKKKNASK